jgi:hypothetical protein
VETGLGVFGCFAEEQIGNRSENHGACGDAQSLGLFVLLNGLVSNELETSVPRQFWDDIMIIRVEPVIEKPQQTAKHLRSDQTRTISSFRMREHQRLPIAFLYPWQSKYQEVKDLSQDIAWGSH